MRTNLFYIVLLAFFLTIGSTNTFSQETKPKNKSFPAKNQGYIPKKATPEFTNTTEVTVLEKDTISLDSLKGKKQFLEGKVKYKAKKYATFDQKKKLITLYDHAELYYQDYELKSGTIIFDYEKNEVYAGRLKDSLGNYTQYPYFKQGSNVIEPDSIRFNYKTKKALVWNSRTTQQELNIKAEISKKISDSIYFMKGARITTAKDLDDPEYYFYTRKVKFVPGKKVVIGATNMYIYNVPTPIALPFAFFPMTEKSRSGIIVPSYGQSNQRGYSLQNGGYYFALNDHYDLALLGDYYTNGSYALRGETSYANKYHYNGTINLRYENQINSERGYPDYSKSTIYNIQWSHSKDAKSNPNNRFSASVNMGSSKYFQQSINQANIGSGLNNTLSSSISYSSTVHTIPQINYSLSATHSQNTNTKSINMTLPTFQASVDRIYPLVGKDGIKKGFIKNINLQYNVRGENSYTTTDDYFFKSQMFENAKTGFVHTIPLSTNFKFLRFFSASTSFNYNEVWTLQTIRKSTDFTNNKVVDDRVNGFDSFRTYSLSNSIGTTIYGTYDFKGKGRIKSIRHVMRPSISHGYTPSFERYYDTYTAQRKYTTNGVEYVETYLDEYTRFQNSISSPNKNYANSVGLSLSNTFEAKVADKDSTKTDLKKIMLLNNFNMGANYDFATSKWSEISITGGTVLLNQKMNINFRTAINPYRLMENDEAISGPFRMTAANITLNYSVANKGGKEKKNTQGEQNGGRSDDLFGSNVEPNELSQKSENQKDDDDKFSGFYNAEFPFDMNFAYSLTYNNTSNQRKITGNTLMVSANTDLTPKWKIGISTGYDFVQKGFSFTQLRLNRDLMSWNMSFNWNPFGQYASWGFFIGIKAGVLKDIKWDKRSLPDRTLK